MDHHDEGDKLLSLDKQLCFALYAASKAMTQAYRPFLQKLGLTYPQYLVFLVLWEEDGISLKALGTKLYLDSGTLTPLLKRLEKQNFIERRRFEKDEREIRICLTGAGKELKDKARTIPESMICQMAIEREDVFRLREEVKGLLRAINSRDSLEPGC
ncbi:MAG: MarR family winged helix-turn-helix transcriptional regulator [Oligoflexus sp.]